MGFFLGIFPDYKPMGFYFGGLQNGEIPYSQTRLIHTLLIHHFCIIRQGNLKTLKPLLVTPM